MKDVANAVRTEGMRVAKLLEWDTTFEGRLKETLLQLERASADESAKLVLYQRWLAHYQAINKYNKSRVKQDFEEALLTWLSPILNFPADSALVTERIVRGFPDTYFPVKVLAPEYLTTEALQTLTAMYPKETMYALRFMIEPKALAEAEMAAVQAPYEARQYLHYSNNVKTLLEQSTDARILKIFDIFRAYRYNSNSFYLLQQIHEGSMSIEEAHNAGLDREKLYNALVDIFITDGAIGKYTAEEKLSEMSDRYVRKLMFQRYLTSSLEIDALELLSEEARLYLLLRSQNLLKKRDLQNLSLLYRQLDHPMADVNAVAGFPVEWLTAFRDRLEKESLWKEYELIIGQDVWASLLPAAPEPDFAPLPLPISEEVEAVPAAPLYVVNPYQYQLSADDKILIRLENNPYELLRDLTKATGQLYSRKMILRLAEEHPVEVMAQLDAFIDQPYAVEVVKTIALDAPLTAKNYLVKAGHPFNGMMKALPDSNVQLLYKIDKELGNWTRAYLLFDKIASGELTIKAADTICKERSLLLPHLIDIFIKPGHLGQYTVRKELEYAALDFIRQFNISENTDRSARTTLDELSSEALYVYLVLGEQEIIGNTFDHMYNRLMARENGRLGILFSDMHYLDIEQFLRLVLHYGKEYDFFNRLSDSDLQSLLSVIFLNLENAEDGEIQRAIEGAEVILSLNNRSILQRIQDIIHQEYERLESERNDEGVAAYGILASILAQKLSGGWASYAAPYYRIPNLVAIPVYSLFNEQLVNIQHYYFYNDRDGQQSYRNFLRQYEGSSYNWKIEDMGDFVRITSINGKTVEIYANKPEAGEEGMEKLEAWMERHDLQPQILVHRGLSTHTLKTFRKVPPSAKLILDGSCGGFHIQGVALENAPGAHILCNRNIGTMHINDPMFKQISESIRQGKDIIWPSFWEDMEARLGSNPYFKDYIPPHKNVAALIIKAYYDVLEISN